MGVRGEVGKKKLKVKMSPRSSGKLSHRDSRRKSGSEEGGRRKEESRKGRKTSTREMEAAWNMRGAVKWKSTDSKAF